MAIIIKTIFHHLCFILDFVTQNHCVNLRLRHRISPFNAILVIIASKSHFTTCSFDHFCVDLFYFILLKLCGKSIFWLTFAVMRFYRILFYTFFPQFVVSSSFDSYSIRSVSSKMSLLDLLIRLEERRSFLETLPHFFGHVLVPESKPNYLSVRKCYHAIVDIHQILLQLFFLNHFYF